MMRPAIDCRGTVKFFNEEKGYGFIICPQGEVFVHYSACPQSGLAAGDAV